MNLQSYFEFNKNIFYLAISNGLIASSLIIFGVIKPIYLNDITIMVFGIILASYTYKSILSYTDKHSYITFMNFFISGLIFIIPSYLNNNLLLATFCLGFLIVLSAFATNIISMITTLNFIFIFIFSQSLKLSTAISFKLSGIFILGGALSLACSLLACSKLPLLPLNSHFFQINKGNLLYAIRLLIAVLIANFISFKIYQGYWVTLTVVLLLKSEHVAIKKRIQHRFTGTLLGAILLLLLFSTIQSKILLALLIFPVLSLILLSINKHYGVYSIFITILVAIIANLSGKDNILTIEYRVLDTLIGISIIASIVILTMLIKYLQAKFMAYNA